MTSRSQDFENIQMRPLFLVFIRHMQIIRSLTINKKVFALCLWAICQQILLKLGVVKISKVIYRHQNLCKNITFTKLPPFCSSIIYNTHIHVWSHSLFYLQFWIWALKVLKAIVKGWLWARVEHRVVTRLDSTRVHGALRRTWG